MAEFLIKHGADPSGKIKSDPLPLEMARSEPIARLLIDAGADVSAASRWGGPLYVARDAAIARLLIEKDAKIDQPRNVFGETPLLNAAIYDRLGVAKVLVEYKANVNAKNSGGKDAASSGLPNRRFVAGCIAGRSRGQRASGRPRGNDAGDVRPPPRVGGGESNTPKFSGCSSSTGHRSPKRQRPAKPFCILRAKSHSVDVAKYLIDAGFDVNAREHDGLTPLHFAARGNDPSDIDMVRLLLKCHADVNAVAVADVQSVRRKITPFGYATIVEEFLPVQADARRYKMAEEDVKQIDRTRRAIADLLRRHGAK